jgi:hypothetical protein
LYSAGHDELDVTQEGSMNTHTIMDSYQKLEEMRKWARMMLDICGEKEASAEEEACLHRYMDINESYFSAVRAGAPYEELLRLYATALEVRCELLACQRDWWANRVEEVRRERRGFA